MTSLRWGIHWNTLFFLLHWVLSVSATVNILKIAGREVNKIAVYDVILVWGGRVFCFSFFEVLLRGKVDWDLWFRCASIFWFKTSRSFVYGSGRKIWRKFISFSFIDSWKSNWMFINLWLFTYKNYLFSHYLQSNLISITAFHKSAGRFRWFFKKLPSIDCFVCPPWFFLFYLR